MSQNKHIEASAPKYERLLLDLSNTHLKIREAVEALSYKLEPLTILVGFKGSCSNSVTDENNSVLNELLIKRQEEALSILDLVQNLTNSIDL